MNTSCGRRHARARSRGNRWGRRRRTGTCRKGQLAPLLQPCGLLKNLQKGVGPWKGCEKAATCAFPWRGHRASASGHLNAVYTELRRIDRTSNQHN